MRCVLEFLTIVTKTIEDLGVEILDRLRAFPYSFQIEIKNWI